MILKPRLKANMILKTGVKKMTNHIIELALPDGPLSSNFDKEKISDIFTNKLGGYPVFLNKSLSNTIPKCKYCSNTLYFILQMECPLPDFDKDCNRILQVYGCNSSKCSGKNDSWYCFFSFVAKKTYKESDLCEKVSSLSLQEEGHSFYPFPEYPSQFPCIALRICEEFWKEPSNKKQQTVNNIITPSIGEEADVYEKILPIGVDKQFESFQKRVSAYPKQCIRYSYGGMELPFNNQLIAIPPPCPICHSPRIFELQLMPAILHYLPVSDDKYLSHIPNDKKSKHPLFGDEMQWGTVLIYSCGKSCYEQLGNQLTVAHCHVQQELE